MKTTGITRRIDELGRIVIPKEIRKTLRIKDGESLEIYVENENIILKKYSIMKKLVDFAQDMTDAVYAFNKHSIVVVDNDTVLAVSGPLKKSLLNKAIGPELEHIILKREMVIEKHKSINLIEKSLINASYAINPIIVSGDAIGAVIILSETELIDDVDLKIVQIVAKFLNNQLEQ